MTYNGGGDTFVAKVGPEAACPHGDADGSGQINVGDVFFIINYLFAGGPAPDPICRGDADGNGTVNVGDVFYLINFLFAGGPPPPV